VQKYQNSETGRRRRRRRRRRRFVAPRPGTTLSHLVKMQQTIVRTIRKLFEQCSNNFWTD
jgi:hypothetical protein